MYKIYVAGQTLYLKGFPQSYLYNSEVEIIDLTGRTLIREKVISPEIPLQSLQINKGVYIIKLISENNIISRKLFIH